jgi:hypothetical protein
VTGTGEAPTLHGVTRPVLALLGALAAALVAAAPLSARPDQTPSRIASYCSPSGDLCYGIFADARFIRFQLTLAARYFGRYRICVRPPRGATLCKSFPVRRMGTIYGGVVRWQRQFPNRGNGVYRVTWRLGTRALGPTLRFRLPR